MKRLSILVLAIAFMLTFSFGILAQNGDNGDGIWHDNAGTDPVTGNGWLIDEGTLDGWSDSNFTILEYQASGKSEVVGTGITVDGIKVDWDYPGSGNIGKGGEVEGFEQSIDYTVVAFADIPCVLKMNVFGNGGWAEGISVGNESEVVLNNGLYMTSENGNGEVAPGNKSHFMIFDTSYGGVVDGDWNFVDFDAVDYAAGEADNLYIHACDLWTADLWANVPFGFAVSSTGMGDFAGLSDPLLIQMRYLERLGAGIVSNRSGLPPYDNDVQLQNNGGWDGDYTLDDDGVEIGQYNAGQNAHINMQFRIPVTGAPAGRYQGEVTFSSYTL